MDHFSTQTQKKIKTCIEKDSELILKKKMRLHQLLEIDPEEIVVYFANAKIAQLLG